MACVTGRTQTKVVGSPATGSGSPFSKGCTHLVLYPTWVRSRRQNPARRFKTGPDELSFPESVKTTHGGTFVKLSRASYIIRRERVVFLNKTNTRAKPDATIPFSTLFLFQKGTGSNNFVCYRSSGFMGHYRFTTTYKRTAQNKLMTVVKKEKLFLNS